MMARLEFTRVTRREALTRSGGKCEAVGSRYGFDPGIRCDAPLAYGVEFDHELPAEFGGDNSLANCRAICRKCHKFATANDIRAIRKSERQRDKHSGAIKPSTRGFRKPDGMEFDWRAGRYVRISQHEDAEAQRKVEQT